MIVDVRKIRLLMADADSLLSYLEGLSNSQFRHVSRLLGDSLLVQADAETFWTLFGVLFIRDRKAYLGTLLKALVLRIEMFKSVCDGTQVLETSGIWDERFVGVCQNLTDTDRKKVLLALLPLVSAPADAERLFRQCGLKESSEWVPFLLLVPTMPCYFLLLKAMRYVEHDRALLIRTCHFLMKRGDGQSFNLASLLRLSFGLEEVRGTFSLSLEPYQLSRIEQNYDAFFQVMGF